MGLIPDELRAGGGCPSRGGDRGRGLAPDHRLRRRRLPAAGAQLDRPHRRRLPAARRSARFPSWRYMLDNGATTIWERWDGWTAETRLPVTRDELLQPLLARLGRRMALPVRPRHRPGARHRRLRPPAAAAAPRRAPQLGPRLLPVRPRDRSARAGRAPGDRFTFRAEIPPNVTASVRVPSARAADVRDAAGNPPASVASFPGAAGVRGSRLQRRLGDPRVHRPGDGRSRPLLVTPEVTATNSVAGRSAGTRPGRD